MTYTPEQLALAREIAANRRGLNALQKCAILDGEWDDISGVQAALAAIVRTTELAATKIDRFCETHEAKRQTTRRYQKEFAAHIDACRNIAASLRSFDHLKGPSDE